MSSQAFDELAVPYDPVQLQARVTRRKQQVRSRVISMIITVVVLVAIYFWQRDQLRGAGFFAVYGIVLAVSVGWLAALVVRLVLARRELASAGEGTALLIGRGGVQVAGLGAAWSEVGSVAVAKGGFGRGPVLRLTLIDGRRAEVGMDQLTVYPATLDSTVRALSAGRHGVDLTALDD